MISSQQKENTTKQQRRDIHDPVAALGEAAAVSALSSSCRSGARARIKCGFSFGALERCTNTAARFALFTGVESIDIFTNPHRIAMPHIFSVDAREFAEVAIAADFSQYIHMTERARHVITQVFYRTVRLNAGEFVVVEDISCLAACRLLTVATLASSAVSQARLRRLFFWTDTLPGKCSAAGIRNSLKRNE